MHAEEAGVQVQVVEGDAVQAPPGPRLLLVLDGLADRRDGGLGDRGLIAQRVSQGGLHVPDRQPPDEGGDHERFERVGLGHMAAEQAGGERLVR